jgi:hypothetical protein
VVRRDFPFFFFHIGAGRIASLAGSGEKRFWVAGVGSKAAAGIVRMGGLFDPLPLPPHLPSPPLPVSQVLAFASSPPLPVSQVLAVASAALASVFAYCGRAGLKAHPIKHAAAVLLLLLFDGGVMAAADVTENSSAHTVRVCVCVSSPRHLVRVSLPLYSVGVSVPLPSAAVSSPLLLIRLSLFLLSVGVFLLSMGVSLPLLSVGVSLPFHSVGVSLPLLLVGLS